MDADQAFRRLQRVGDVLQTQAGRVGRQHRVRPGHAFEPCEQRPLGGQVLEDRLDDHVRTRRAVALRVGNQAIEREAHLPFIAPVLALEELRRTRDRRRDPLHRLILQRHRHAALRAHRRDVAAHHAGADHMHMARDEGRNTVRRLAHRLQALLQKEHAHQVLRGRRAEDRVERGRIVGRHRQRIAAELRPGVDDRVGRRVVLAARTGRDLLARPAGHDRLQRPVQQPHHQRQAPHPMTGQDHRVGGVLHHAHRHAHVGQTDAFRLGRIDRLAGQHHVERCGRSDQLRQPHHAAPGRHDAEHDLGQREPGVRLVDDDAVTAGQRQLQPAAHAVPPDQRKRRKRQARQPVEQRPAALDQVARGLGRIDAGELVDVGAGNEAGRLGRRDDQAGGRTALQRLEQAGEFVEHVRGQRVRRRSGLVQMQPRDAVRLAHQDKMLVGVRHRTASTSIAPPCPPPIQIAATPRCTPSRRRTCTRCSTMRAPLAPTG